MENFEKEFIMGLFLENESVSDLNRIIVTAVTDVVKEMNENDCLYEDSYKKESEYWQPELNSKSTETKLDKKARKRKRSKSRKRSRNIIETTEKIRVKHELGDFYQDFVSKYTNSEFEEMFKMKRSTFEELVKTLWDHLKIYRSLIPLEKKMQVFICSLTSDASFLEVGNLFGLNRGTVFYIFHEISEMIIDQLRYSMVSWPSVEEQHMTKLKVHSRLQFPNCVGFIDACRLKVRSKKKHGKPDIVLLQAVCDDSLMFTDIYVGDSGKTKKSKVFKESPLFNELSNFVAFENHILGGSEYKLRVNLMTPFTSEEVLTIEEMTFNETHWKARGYIGRAFEILRERFRKLNFIDINKPDAVNNMITAACILHNFILIHEGSPEVKEEVVTYEVGVDIDPETIKTASEKRQFLCNYINFIDKERM